jgi:hypothetical protein
MYLHCILTGTPIALHRVMAEYFASFPHKPLKGGIPCGGLISRIAERCDGVKYYGYVNRNRFPSLPPRYFGY